MNETAQQAGRNGNESGYWSQRRTMMYYKYVDVFVRAFAADAKSLLDVGSNNTPIIEEFSWIPRRDALDLVSPYRSRNVRGLRMNFFDFHPEERYDFATCLQVLEHIPDAGRFARHLLEVADNVLVSVPFMWPEGSNPHHVHDPVSREKLLGWMGRKPTHELVVTEPLHVKKNARLIAYFHTPESRFSLREARDRWLASLERDRLLGGQR